MQRKLEACLVAALIGAGIACSGSSDEGDPPTEETSESGQSGGEGLPPCEGAGCPTDESPDAAVEEPVAAEGLPPCEGDSCPADGTGDAPVEEPAQGLPICQGSDCPADVPVEVEGCGVDDETGVPYENCGGASSLP